MKGINRMKWEGTYSEGYLLKVFWEELTKENLPFNRLL